MKKLWKKFLEWCVAGHTERNARNKKASKKEPPHCGKCK